MRSFQLHLAIVAVLVFGGILAGIGMAWHWLLYQQFMRSVDARLSVPVERAYGQSGGRDRLPDWTRLEREWSQSWGDPTRGTDRKVLIGASRSGEREYQSLEEPWLDNVDLTQYQALEAEFEDRPRPEPPDFPPPAEGGFRPPPRRDRPPPPAPARFFTLRDDQGAKWRFVAFGGPTYTVYSGVDLAVFHPELAPARHMFLVLLAVALGMTGLGAWLVAKSALRPLHRISDTASQITASGLDRRIDQTDRDFREFSQLAGVLNDMMARLERSFHQANRFTADASHELKTPITILQAEISTALKTCDPESEQETSLLQMAHEVQRLKQITQSLLLLSRADAGQLRIESQLVDLSEVLSGIAEDTELLCEEAGLQFVQEIERGVSVQGEQTLLAQAMQNLLQNAVKYNRKGGEVRCRLMREGETAVVEVRNTGQAIPEEEQRKIFDRFYRMDPARSRNADGFGLGLNLAMEIVKIHGGSVCLVESREDLNRFRVELPLASG